MAKNKYTKNIHRFEYYDDEKNIEKVSGGNKHQNLLEENEYNNISIDEFEKENPDLAAQCRQFLPKI